MKEALLVIDVQNEYFTGKLPVTYPTGSFNNIKKAIASAAKANIPIVLIQHTAPQSDSATFRKGSYEWNLHEDILTGSYNVIIEKNLPDSFANTTLNDWLEQNGVDTVVICGYMTQMCCDTTARQAVHIGYSVKFLSDATGTLAFSNEGGSVTDEELHRATLVTQAIRFSKIMTTKVWVSSLGIDA